MRLQWLRFANNHLFLHVESRALSVPVKTMLHIHEGRRSPEERMKEFIGILWNAVKSLTLQVNLSVRIIIALCLIILYNFTIFNCDIIFLSTFPWSVLSLVHWCTMFIVDSISVVCLVPTDELCLLQTIFPYSVSCSLVQFAFCNQNYVKNTCFIKMHVFWNVSLNLKQFIYSNYSF